MGTEAAGGIAEVRGAGVRVVALSVIAALPAAGEGVIDAAHLGLAEVGGAVVAVVAVELHVAHAAAAHAEIACRARVVVIAGRAVSDGAVLTDTFDAGPNVAVVGAAVAVGRAARAGAGGVLAGEARAEELALYHEALVLGKHQTAFRHAAGAGLRATSRDDLVGTGAVPVAEVVGAGVAVVTVGVIVTGAPRTKAGLVGGLAGPVEGLVLAGLVAVGTLGRYALHQHAVEVHAFRAGLGVAVVVARVVRAGHEALVVSLAVQGIRGTLLTEAIHATEAIDTRATGTPAAVRTTLDAHAAWYAALGDGHVIAPARIRVTGVYRAWIAVVAVHRHATPAGAHRAGLGDGAGIAVITHGPVGQIVFTAGPFLAEVRRAGVPVLAIHVALAAEDALVHEPVAVIIEVVAALRGPGEYRRVRVVTVQLCREAVAVRVTLAGARRVDAGAGHGIAAVDRTVVAIVAVDRDPRTVRLQTDV